MSHLVQLVLDLFDSAPVSAHATVPDARNAKPEPPQCATPQGPHQPPEPLGQVLPRAQYTHPRATRRIQLGNTDVAYAFRRSKRRTIGMAVGPDGLEVSAPRWVTLGEVESALREKGDWIARKLVEMDDRQQQLGAARIVWADGVVLPYLGGSLTVVLDSTATLKKNSAQLETASQARVCHDRAALSASVDAQGQPGGLSPLRQVLRLGLPLHAAPEQIRDAAQAWLMRQAKALFTERLNHFAPQLQVRWQRLSLSSAATRWGSASAQGAIRLNWRLVHHKLDVIDYVVAHELSHLREMNHSPRFWDTVKSVMPDYEMRRRVLRDNPLPPWT